MGSWSKHIIIPDTQCKSGVPLDHLTWAGRYIAEKADENTTVIHLGDHWDMPSLSSYDRGKKCFEGRRYKADILAGNLALDMLSKPLARIKRPPRKIFIPGNHEERILRAVDTDAQLEGILGWHDFNLSAHGWELQPYLKPISLNGILYCHYFYQPKSGRPYSGTCHTILRQVGHSFVQGHRQGLDVAIHDLPNGGRRRGIIAGSFYQHSETYLGAQGNYHWRGILVLHEVRQGNFDLSEVSLDYLRRKYS